MYKSCVRQLVDAVFTQGARCSCFTYGQTGSGKTFTMVGPERMGTTHVQTPPESQGNTQRNRMISVFLMLLNFIGLLELAARDCFKWLQRPEFDYHFGQLITNTIECGFVHIRHFSDAKSYLCISEYL